MTTSVAWIDGQWGTAASLQLPLDDRALLLADGLFETVLIRNGGPQLLQEHLQRWSESAALLGMDPPPQRNALEPLITEAIQRSQLSEADGALRLNWSRGSTPQRGIGLPAQGHHRLWLTLLACTPTFSAVSTITSRHERRNASSRLSRCKTFAYGQSIQARREAQDQGADDALLLNTAGALCCGTAANLLVRRRGQWLTPPLSSGCLPRHRGGNRAGGRVRCRRSGCSDQQPQLSTDRIPQRQTDGGNVDCSGSMAITTPLSQEPGMA